MKRFEQLMAAYEALECFREVLELDADDVSAAAAVVDLERVLFEFPVE